MPIRLIKQFTEWLESLDFGKKVLACSWLEDAHVFPALVSEMYLPWISLSYSRGPAYHSELENHYVSPRLPATEVWPTVNAVLEKWSCPLQLTQIDFEASIRERRGITTIELKYQSLLAEPRFRLLIRITEKPQLIPFPRTSLHSQESDRKGGEGPAISAGSRSVSAETQLKSFVSAANTEGEIPKQQSCR